KQRTEHAAAPAQVQAPQQDSALVAPKISESKLKDLAWSLNIKDTESPSGRVGQTQPRENFQI
ncbi:MAG TPA: hypothetical protein VF803_03810, partial [Candidatus Paceibacterota bacterium]